MLRALTFSLLVGVAASNSKFKADLRHETSVATEMGSMKTSIVTEFMGDIYYDGVFQRVRLDIKSVELKADTGSGMDLNGYMDHGDHGRRLIALDVDMVNLLRWDMKKNFTWVTMGGETECECADLDSPFLPMQVPPDATFVQKGTIPQLQGKSGEEVGENLLLEKKEITFPGFDSKITFYEDKQGALRRTESTFTMSMGSDMKIEHNDTYNFWNVETTFADTIFDPLPSCFCGEKIEPKLAVIEPPAKGSTCTPTDGCMCMSASVVDAEVVFCNEYATYPVNSVLFPKETDDFVKTAYDNDVTIAGQSQTCKDDYKKWLCTFYFKKCENGELTTPKAFDATSCSDNPAESKDSPTKSFYSTIEKSNNAIFGNAGGNAGGDVKFSAAPSTQPSLVVAFTMALSAAVSALE